MCPPGHEGSGGGGLAVVLPHAGVPEVARVGCGGRGQRVPVPSGIGGVPVTRGLVVLLGGGGVVPGAWGPKGGREGRARNRRLRAVDVTRGPRSRGDVGVLEEGDMGVTVGGHRRRGTGELPPYCCSPPVLLGRGTRGV